MAGERVKESGGVGTMGPRFYLKKQGREVDRRPVISRQ